MSLTLVYASKGVPLNSQLFPCCFVEIRGDLDQFLPLPLLAHKCGRYAYLPLEKPSLYEKIIMKSSVSL